MGVCKVTSRIAFKSKIMTKTLEEIKVKFSLKYTIFNLEKKMETDELYIQMVFCGNWSGYAALMWCHFECTCENGDVGYCGFLAGVRKSVPLIRGAGGGGGEGEYLRHMSMLAKLHSQWRLAMLLKRVNIKS